MPQIVSLGRHNAVELRVDRRPWSHAADRPADVARHWRLAKALSPSYYNGAVHMLTSGRDLSGIYRGELLASDFRSFIHWRALGHPDRSVRATGVGAVLWSADGAALLGTAAPGTTNAGRTYLFSGVLDDRDIDHHASADVLAGALRELVEETGLEAGELTAASPWIWSIEDGVWINFVAERRSRLDADELRQRIIAHNARQAERGLSDIVILRGAADLDRPDIFDNTRALLGRLFAERK
jgi:8-oxo-dGTP pyrophosphatase MutT (NUDIX family)